MVLAVPVMIGVAVLAAYFQSKTLRKAVPALEAQAQFIMLVGSGQVGPARGMCAPDIDEGKLTELVETIESFGTLVDTDKYFGGKVHSEHDIEIQTKMAFSGHDKVFVGRWSMPNGVPQLMRFHIETPQAPATRPAAPAAPAK